MTDYPNLVGRCTNGIVVERSQPQGFLMTRFKNEGCSIAKNNMLRNSAVGNSITVIDCIVRFL